MSWVMMILIQLKIILKYYKIKVELMIIRMMLKHRRILKLVLSVEQNEYKYMKQLNKCITIKSRKEYKDKHEMYIEEPEKYFKKKD
jgi:hypothetical protein